MANISFACEAKSDQLNAVDIMGVEPVIRIREVRVAQGEQPVWVFFDGDNNRPWKPSKGMLRIMMAAWGVESDEWVGKRVKLYFEPTVTWAGEQVGGIRIRALSSIKADGMLVALTLNRKKRVALRVELLPEDTLPPYPEEKFLSALPAMQKAMEDGKMSLQQVIAQCQKTGNLSEEQIATLESAVPVEHEEEEGGEV